MEENKKKNKRKVTLIVIGTLLCVCILLGISFAYYNATVSKVNETDTKVQTNTLGLIYKGEKEINYQSMIPGDSFEKTFTVENTSNTPVTYNIYMEGITNEYNEDLVYTLYETDSTGANPVAVVTETLLPETNANKWYLKTNISINAAPTKKYYKLVIEYKYLANAPQNNYQGKVFEATLGIDTVQNAENPEQLSYIPWEPTYFSYDLSGVGGKIPPESFTTTRPDDSNLYIGKDEQGNIGVCVVFGVDEHCFKTNDVENERVHLEQISRSEEDYDPENDNEYSYFHYVQNYQAWPFLSAPSDAWVGANYSGNGVTIYSNNDYESGNSFNCSIMTNGDIWCDNHDYGGNNCAALSTGDAYCMS